MARTDAPEPCRDEDCRGCGTATPNYMGIHLWRDGDRLRGWVRFDADQEGAPGWVHGGAVATVIDDALGTLCMHLGSPSVTANLTIDYRAPVAVGDRVEILVWRARLDGRKSVMAGELRRGDTLVAEATGLFVLAPPDHFATGFGTRSA